jgi:hypothetical protein
MEFIGYKECIICKAKNVQPAHFWKEHHIKEADYCHSYIPRHSKLTGNLLPFKSREFYFNSDFENKNELKKWLSEQGNEGLEYAISILRNRWKQRKIKYAPSQVELRSMIAPPVIWYEKFCDYNYTCKSIGIDIRFSYQERPTFKVNHDLIISVDTREQKALQFKNSKTEKLDFGDYWASKAKWKNVFIERKGLSDFISTLASGFERFEREIIRAKEAGKYLFILVEESITNAMSFNFLPHISRNVKASPDFIFKRVRDLMQKYDNIQFLFANNREDCVNLIYKIYGCSKNPTTLDFQFLRDSKLV